MKSRRLIAFGAMFLIAGCGGSSGGTGSFSNSAPTTVQMSSTTPGLSGRVFSIGPRRKGESAPGAVVTLKDYQGNFIDSTIADADGYYSFSRSLPAGPYFAEARTDSGLPLYGVGDAQVLNITPLTDFVIREYYRALQLDPGQLSPSDPRPDPEDISDAAEAMFEFPQVAVGLPGLFDPITSPMEAPFASLLGGLTFVPGGLRVTAPSGESQESLVTVESEPGERLVLIGSTTVSEPGQAPQTLPLKATLGTFRANEPYGAWMADIASFIGKNRLADTILPGTHDAASSGIVIGGGAAITQALDLEGQLSKGIRYLDLRLTEIPHFGKATRGTFYFHHGLYSYTLSQGLQMMRNFLTDKRQSHAREIFHLDAALTNEIQKNPEDVQTLLQVIKDDIGLYLIPNDIPEVDWRTHTLEQIWEYNRIHGTRYQIVLTWPYFDSLPNNGLKRLVWNDSLRHSKYWDFSNGDANTPPNTAEFMKRNVDMHLCDRTPVSHFVLPDGKTGQWYFDRYREAQQRGEINILQCVTTPTVVRSAAQFALPSYSPGALLDFGRITNENFANHKKNAAEVNGVDSGWLGQRLWASHYGNPAALQAGQWNRANVVMIDAFDSIPAVTWRNMAWGSANSKWAQIEESASFVRFIVEANKRSGLSHANNNGAVIFTDYTGNLQP